VIAPTQAARTRQTTAQRERRRRILDSAIALAAEGGYEAVQMREVALAAGVALGTLYRYFSSKEHLLVAAMAEQVGGLRQRFIERPPRGDTPAERVVDVIRRATRALQRQPNVTTAMLKSLISTNVSAHEAVAATMQTVSREMTEIVIAAMHEGPASPRDEVVSQVVQHVWMTSLLWWVAGLAPARQVEDTTAKAVELLLGNGSRGGATLPIS